MTQDSRTILLAETGLDVVDVLAEHAPADRLAELQTLHLHHFPDHAHVCAEFADVWENGSPDPEVVIHGWILERQGAAVGYLVFHTNRRRRIAVQHFVGMDEQVRADLPFRWIRLLSDALIATAQVDLPLPGQELLGSVGENPPQHVAAWRRLGYRLIDVDYREPLHGMHWRDFGEPTFFPMVAMVRLTETGEAAPFSLVATASVSAFLLDHYRLPADNPTVAGILERAAALAS